MTAVAKTSLLIGLMLLSGASLSACNRKSESDALANDTFAVPSAAKGDQFGKGFGEAFRADPNSEPANVARNDVIPVSKTAEPVEFN